MRRTAISCCKHGGMVVVSTNLTLLGRALRAEASKLASLRSTWVVLVLAVMGPLLIATIISFMNSLVADFAGEMALPIESVLYWTRTLGVTIFMVWAISTVTTELKYGTLQSSYSAVPQWGLLLVAKWWITGALALLATAVAQPVTVAVQKLLFPSIAGPLPWADHQALQFFFCQPVYAFLACGVGVGLGALLTTAAAAVGVMLVWQLVVELAIHQVWATAYVWLPFYNAALFSGEVQTVPSPIGPVGAGLYWLLLALIMIGGGVYRLYRTQRRT